MKNWTIMIFMAGDNDLEDAAHADLFEMLKVGSNDEINVIVQFDSQKNGTIRYYIQPRQLKPLGEPIPNVNTGDPAILTGFIKWGRDNYPAQHFLLVIWNHGNGWENVSADFNWQSIRGRRETQGIKRSIFKTTIYKLHAHSRKSRAIALDASSRDFLDNRELKEGLANALIGDKLDIVGFDACLMGMLEIGYQLRDQAHYMIASQEVEPHFGWPYEKILHVLYKNPDMSPRDLSTFIVRSYGQMGIQIRTATKYTLSAIDLNHIDLTFSLTQELAECLSEAYPENLSIRKVINEASSQRRGAKRFRDGNSVDFYDWIWRIWRLHKDTDSKLKDVLTQLMNHLNLELDNSLIIANSAEVGDDRDQVHGVSIYLPQRKKYSSLYEDLDFAQTGWGSFVKKISETIR